jgi:hypothetical protein
MKINRSEFVMQPKTGSSRTAAKPLRAGAADFVVKELTAKQWLRKMPLVSY